MDYTTLLGDKNRFNEQNKDLSWKEFSHDDSALKSIQKKIHFLINTQNGTDIDDYTVPEGGSFVQKSKDYFLNKDVLIVGTGTGREMVVAREHGAKSVSGITMGARNQKFAKNIVGETPVIVDAHACPWGNEVFDVILGFQVLEHMYSPIMFLLECNRLLRIGGSILMETPPSKTVSTDSWLHHIICPTPRQLICLYMKAGFKPVEYRGVYDGAEIVKDVSGINTTSSEQWLDVTDCNVFLRGTKMDPNTYERGDIKRYYDVMQSKEFKY